MHLHLLKFFLCTLFLGMAGMLQAKGLELTLNQQTHALEASPGACSYHWFKDGKKISQAKEAHLTITEPGTYKVVAETIEGEVLEEQAELVLSATGALVRIYTIGDSTVQDYNTGYYPRKGWGQVLQSFFNAANVQIINKAVGGTSSKSFYKNQWPAIRNVLAAGDFVFIQFGINDRNSADTARYAPTGGVFESFLTKFVNETKAKGAFPVLVSTLRRNAWNANGTVYDAYHEHPVAVRTVAKNLNVPLIDLDAKAKKLMESLGEAYCTKFLYNNYEAGEYPNYANGNADNVHFQEMGAIAMAKLVAEGISELGANANVSTLIPSLKPQYPINISVNPTGSDVLTTRSASYPQGLTITLKTLPKTAGTFQKWNNAADAQLATTTLTTVTSGSTATSYTAVYKGAVTNCTTDACGRCVGANTGLTACSSVAEVETEACSYEGVTENTNTGYVGTAYLNGTNAIGASVNFIINATSAGTKTISFRYANGSANDRVAKVTLNGVALASNLSFPSTTAFTTWKTIDLQLNLLKGPNNISLSATTAEGLANIDQIGYVSSGLSRGACVVTDISDLQATTPATLYPNPSKEAFTFEAQEPVHITLFGPKGEIVLNQEHVQQLKFGENLPKGIYLLKVSSTTETKTFKIEKE